MKQKFLEFYMDIALRTAQLSHCTRLQVGAIIVKDDRIISIGYNGTIPGASNSCEKNIFPSPELAQWEDPEDIEEMFPFVNELGQRYKKETLPEVLHAEENAIGKLAKSKESGKDATMFLSHSPCIHCAKTIFVSGITDVYYNEIYRDDSGLNFLSQCRVTVNKLNTV